MTKEQRFGLLVGMVFIIAFGLILSELTGTDAAPSPPAAEEEYLGMYAHAPVIEDVAMVPFPPPRQPVRTVAMAPPPAPAPGAAGVVEAALSRRPQLPGAGGRVEAELHPRPSVLSATSVRGDAPADAALAPGPPAPQKSLYTVQPNDTLIRIARQVYGRGKEGYYKLIYKANRASLPDESTLRIGQELVIPPLSDRVAQPAARPGGAAPSPVRAPARPAAPSGPPARRSGPADGRFVEVDVGDLEEFLRPAAPAREAPRCYVVRRGDNLTDIARRLLRDDSPAAVQKLYGANRDRLQSPHQLPVGLELAVPS